MTSSSPQPSSHTISSSPSHRSHAGHAMIWYRAEDYSQGENWARRDGRSLCGQGFASWGSIDDPKPEVTCPECLIILANQEIRKIAEIGFRDRMKKCLTATAKEKR